MGKKLMEKIHPENRVIKILLKTGETPSEKNDRCEYVFGDLLDKESLHRATRDVNLVIHLAAVTHTNKTNLYYKVNVEGTENLLAACEENGVGKIIHVSSRTASVDGGDYAKSKLRSEDLVKKSSLDWLIFKLSEVYGAGGKGGINQLISLIKKSYFVPVIGAGNYTLSPVSIDDAVAVIAAGVSSDIHKKTFVIAGPEVFTYNEIIDQIAGQMRVGRLKIHVPVIVIATLAKFMQMIRLDVVVRDQIPRLLCEKPTDISLAVRHLNYKPKTFKNGLREYLKGYKPNTHE